MRTFVGLIVVATLILTGCSHQPQEAAPASPAAAPAARPGKDLVTFLLPKSVTDAAPAMQDHLNRALPYNTTRWQVKPAFVFLEGDDEIKGELSDLVTRLNLLHMAYYRDEELVWSGSLMHAWGRGHELTAQAGYQIGLTAASGMLTLTFRDGDRVLTQQLPIDEDSEHTLTEAGVRLYVNHYVFPASLVQGSKP